MSIVVGMGIVGALVLIASALFIWTVASSTRVRGVDPDWLGSFSVATYRPMERLLSEDDIRFLKSQPGYEPNMEKVLRSDRRKIFRTYLRSLGRDFNRLHLALRLVDQAETAVLCRAGGHSRKTAALRTGHWDGGCA